jgi:hypothetical protein
MVLEENDPADSIATILDQILQTQFPKDYKPPRYALAGR